MNLKASIHMISSPVKNPVSTEPSEHGMREFETHHNRDEVVCVDFDGVLSDSGGPYQYGHFGPPIKVGIRLLKMLISHKYRPVILTARRETDLVANWLRDKGFAGLMVVNHKVPAVAYVDDRAIHFDGDSSALDIFKKIEKRAKG